jgi:F-type H+-transporting ATPase subunit delta
MTIRTAANRYARALLDVAVKEQADLDAVERDLSQFADLLAGNAALREPLLNPVVPVTRKRAAMVELTTRAHVVGVVAKLLVLLAERDRLAILPDLVAMFRQRLMDHQKVVRAEVTTTSELGADQLKRIERTFAKATGRTVSLSARIDPSIIGGMVAKVGGTVYDASVARQLERMRQQMAHAQ